MEVPHAQALKNEGVTTLVGAVKAGQSAGVSRFELPASNELRELTSTLLL